MDFSLNWSMLLLLYFHLLTTASGLDQSPYKPTDQIRLNNGESSDTQSDDGLNWEGDFNSKYCLSNPESSSASVQSSGVPTVPYLTARLIRSNFTCIFPVTMGPKFLRLYFYPATYSSLPPSDSFFSVTANGFSLLKNFSAQSHANESSFLEKEFIVTVFESQQLSLTFTPSPNSFAFINGIEIVSMPGNLYFKDMAYPYRFVNQLNNPFHFSNSTSLENIVRLNVGGQLVNDTMFRKWFDDSTYLLGRVGGLVHAGDVIIKYTKDTPAYVAPEAVYKTKRTMDPDNKVNLNYNLTWILPKVDSGFNYLVRLHFCETEKEINKHDIMFYIYINNMTAEQDADVIYWSGGRTIPVYKDYIVWVPDIGSHTKQDLWLALHPNTISQGFYNAILNGVEIFKLSSSDKNLAGSNPELIAVSPSPEQRPTSQKSKGPSIVIPVSGAAIGVVITFCLILSFFMYRRKGKGKGKGKDATITTRGKSLWVHFLDMSGLVPNDIALSLPTDLCRQFTMHEIKAATRNFDRKNVIGSGGFGTVYKGFVDNHSSPVAIKRLDPSSKQGIREFRTEIEMLSKLRHAHLVSLIGYCDDQDQMILVYEFMAQGNLQDHIYKAKKCTLPWKQRLKICIGAARGLHYLHTGAKHSIIHRDVKSSNILLDSNLLAKVSDFGLSKMGPTSESQTHVSTVVRGSFGYLDPEYYRRQQLTEKSDVYSFGVVLFEVLYARAPIMPTLSKEEVNLVGWAIKCYKKGTFDQTIDPQLKGDIAMVSLNKFMEIAVSCVGEKSTERPTMGDVVWGLEFALQLQETTEKNVDDAYDIAGERHETSFQSNRGMTNTDDDDLFTSSSTPILGSKTAFTTSRSTFNNSTNSDQMRPENVFSEIMNQDGR